MISKISIVIEVIIKILKKKFFYKSKKKKLFIKKHYLKNNSLEILSRTFLACLMIISIFSISPILVDFFKSNNLMTKEFKNNSKNNFDKTLGGEVNDKLTKLDDGVNQKFLFDDVFNFEALPSNTIRLSASTIKQLYKDTNYNLQDVRKNKLVKPVSLSLLPSEMKRIENTKERKELFIQIILPLVIKESNHIRSDRIKLFSILNKNRNTKIEKNWLEKKFKQYGVLNKDLSTLKIRLDEVPISIAIAQAAKETGWGTSRFAQEGNALFGQWTWSGEGIKPASADVDSTHKVMKFKVLQASVKAYHRNINTHSSYKKFRSIRAQLRDEDKQLDSLILLKYLDKYAETGKEYVKILEQIIRQNKLQDFDDAKLLPSSIELESLI